MSLSTKHKKVGRRSPGQRWGGDLLQSTRPGKGGANLLKKAFLARSCAVFALLEPCGNPKRPEGGGLRKESRKKEAEVVRGGTAKKNGSRVEVPRGERKEKRSPFLDLRLKGKALGGFSWSKGKKRRGLRLLMEEGEGARSGKSEEVNLVERAPFRDAQGFRAASGRGQPAGQGRGKGKERSQKVSAGGTNEQGKTGSGLRSGRERGEGVRGSTERGHWPETGPRCSETAKGTRENFLK